MKRRQFVGFVVAAAMMPQVASAERVAMTVHKDPGCSCCVAWSRAYATEGYIVDERDENDMQTIKVSLKVPPDLQGCHTAVINGYYVEGHVPIEAVEKLLTDRPELAGLAVAGMPRGSLGMGDSPKASYDVMAVPLDGSTPYVFMAVRPS
jgi:hypothetical protein